MGENPPRNVTIKMGINEETHQLFLKMVPDIEKEYFFLGNVDVERIIKDWEKKKDNAAWGLFQAILGNDPAGLSIVYSGEHMFTKKLVTTVPLFFVRPKYRMTRTAGILFNSIMQWSKNRSVDCVIFGVTSGDHRADRFFQGCNGRLLGGNYLFTIV